MVQCAWCYGKLQGWEQGDNPLTEHARHFASCPKFGNQKVISASSLVKIHHIQGRLNFILLVNSQFILRMIKDVFMCYIGAGQDFKMLFIWSLSAGVARANELSEEDLGIITVRPCNPQFAIEASRLESYKNKWCSNLTQTPDTLSSAGFFYVGEFTIGSFKLKN